MTNQKVKLLESVINFSEGRNASKIAEIVESVRTIKQVNLLNIHSDADHNRSVITIIGEISPIIIAAFKVIKTCTRLIDINNHQGVHPYIGVVDVVPFIPYKNTNMQEAAYAAAELSKRVWQELQIPVYLYGEASIIPHRSNLANVRRGGFQALKQEIGQNDRYPDVGKPILHPTAGAVSIGARNFLIAYNINLDSNDLETAKKIAREIREKHGGPAGVKAIGVPLESRGIVQVSINITDHKETSIKKVYDLVKIKAKEHHIDILESEIVGMIPKSAYYKGMEKDLKIKNNIQKMILPE